MQSNNNDSKGIIKNSSDGRDDDNRNLYKSDVENSNVISNDNIVQTKRNAENILIGTKGLVENTKLDNLEQDERFSPEKENALQTLDAVIQEVENSLGTIRNNILFIYGSLLCMFTRNDKFIHYNNISSRMR